MKFRGLRTPTPTHGKRISVPTQPRGSGSLVPGDQRKSNFLNQTSQEMECPGGTGAEQASGAFPSSILDVPAKSPQPPALLGGRGGRRGGAPRLPSPSLSWPPPALPGRIAAPIVPAVGQLLLCSSPTPPPQPSPLAISKSRPHSPLGNWEREGSPRSRLLGLDPHQHSHPHSPRDAGQRVWYQSDYAG